MNFVKFDCGCCGIIPDHSSNPIRYVEAGAKTLIFHHCDNDDGMRDYHICQRNMLDKEWTTLKEDEILKVLNSFGKLIIDGYKFRELKLLLKD
ncbi:MAG: hypothetical protein JSW11_00780 [Candidatus Heimdallarchaeota archaeon]|nr:MAG: hypothetical protein JSW11_00780 [Candidatus Heimdallarchaeota archaeon]